MKKNNSNHCFSVIKFIITVDISVFQVAELKAHMPMEMLRMIKRTFRDALGKLLHSKPLLVTKAPFHFDENSLTFYPYHQ